MRTLCYVDGYNLYYGCLKGTAYKWLDIYQLFNRIIKEQNPQNQLIQIKFFTAPVKTKLASHGVLAGISQADYHRALEQIYPDKIQIIEGYFSMEEGSFLEYRKPPDKARKVKVWRLEEKQTDVNIAISAYRDLVKDHAAQIIFVSNDTDLEPVLKAIREDFGNSIKIGVILPIREAAGTSKPRPGNHRLSDYADWTRHSIKNLELTASQLPDKVPTRKKPILKPEYW